MTWGPMGRASDYPDHDDSIDARTAERRSLFREAYMAALGGYCSRPYYDAPDGQRQELNPSRCACIDALETVRQWDEMMAAVDGEEG